MTVPLERQKNVVDVAERLRDQIGAASESQGAKADSALQPEDFPVLSPNYYEAIGDGTTNDQSAFDQLEAASPGEIIDLGNKTYRVTTVPKNCRYWNGRFYDGVTYYPAMPFPWIDPMDGECVIVDKSTNSSLMEGGIIWREDEDEIITIQVIGTGHTNDEGSAIIIQRSQDGGDRFTGLKSIYSSETDYYIRGAVFGAMAGNRIGGIFKTGLDDGTSKIWFIYSDDINSLTLGTWTTVELTPGLVLPDHHPYGLMLPWPTAAGGDDVNGFQIITYGGSNSVKSIRTKDNGATWTDVLIKNSVGLPSGLTQETSMAKADQGWVMVTRTSANGNAFASTSGPDMTSWTAWVDTGIPLGSNPVHVLIDGGNVNVYASYREAFPGSVDENSTVHYSAPVGAFFADPTVIGKRQGRLISTLPDRAIAYFRSVKTPRGNWYHIMMVGQGDSTSDGSGSATCLIRQRRGAQMGIAAQWPTTQLVENPVFRTWPRGTSWSGISASVGGPGRWRLLAPASTSYSAVQVDVPEHVRKAFPVRAEHGIHFSNVGATVGVGISQRWIDDDARAVAAIIESRQRVTVRLYGFGAFPTAAIRALFLVNGQAMTFGTFDVPQGISGEGGWVTEAVIRHESLISEGIASLDLVTRVELYIYNNTDAAELSMKIYGVFCFLDTPPMEPPLPTFSDDRRATDRYCEKLTFAANQPVTVGAVRTATANWAALQYSEKATNPTSVTASVATDFQGRDSSDFIASALTFAALGRKSCRMVLTIAGATTGRAQIIETVGSPSADPHILIDTGY